MSIFLNILLKKKMDSTLMIFWFAGIRPTKDVELKKNIERLGSLYLSKGKYYTR
jgi:hypothetical protein